MTGMMISGLASGLDTVGIVNDLMRLEAIPQNQLKNRLAGYQEVARELQALNTQAVHVQTLANELADPSGWMLTTASSSSADVAVSAAATAAPVAFSFTVNQAATAHQLTFNATAHASDAVVSGGTEVKLAIGDQTHILDTSDGSFEALVDTVNAANLGVRASTIKLDDGSFRLSLTATETGAASTFTLTNTDGSELLGGAVARAGQDAQIVVGADVIHSPSNTFTDLSPGLSLTVSPEAVGQNVDVAVSPDNKAVADKVADLIQRLNATLDQIDRRSGYNPETRVAGPLASNNVVRDFRNALANTVYPTDGGTLASIGIEIDSTGKFTFDREVFSTAYAADPAGTVNNVGAQFASRVAEVAAVASDRDTGTLTNAIISQNSMVDRVQDDISAWDRRLELRRTTLERQFAALETTLSQMQAQSNWLAGQLDSLAMSTGRH